MLLEAIGSGVPVVSAAAMGPTEIRDAARRPARHPQPLPRRGRGRPGPGAQGAGDHARPDARRWRRCRTTSSATRSRPPPTTGRSWPPSMAAPSSATGAAPSAPARRVARAACPGGGCPPSSGCPLISLLGSLALIPVIASVGGAHGWAAVALGQALGGGAATVLQYGWGFSGPTRMVSLSRARPRPAAVGQHPVPADRRRRPVPGHRARRPPLLAPDGFRAAGRADRGRPRHLGLSALWFFVGTGRPGQAARYETVPRLVVLLVAGRRRAAHPGPDLVPGRCSSPVRR